MHAKSACWQDQQKANGRSSFRSLSVLLVPCGVHIFFPPYPFEVTFQGLRRPTVGPDDAWDAGSGLRTHRKRLRI